MVSFSRATDSSPQIGAAHFRRHGSRMMYIDIVDAVAQIGKQIDFKFEAELTMQ